MCVFVCVCVCVGGGNVWVGEGGRGDRMIEQLGDSRSVCVCVCVCVCVWGGGVEGGDVGEMWGVEEMGRGYIYLNIFNFPWDNGNKILIPE